MPRISTEFDGGFPVLLCDGPAEGREAVLYILTEWGDFPGRLYASKTTGGIVADPPDDGRFWVYRRTDRSTAHGYRLYSWEPR